MWWLGVWVEWCYSCRQRGITAELNSCTVCQSQTIFSFFPSYLCFSYVSTEYLSYPMFSNFSRSTNNYLYLFICVTRICLDKSSLDEDLLYSYLSSVFSVYAHAFTFVAISGWVNRLNMYVPKCISAGDVDGRVCYDGAFICFIRDTKSVFKLLISKYHNKK